MGLLAKALALAGLAMLAVASPAQGHYRYMAGKATAYHQCDGSSTATAGAPWGVAWGRAAAHGIPYGTWIEVVKPADVGGRRFFVINDTGSADFTLDFYAKSCTWMHMWGRRQVTFRLVPRHHMWRGKPEGGWRWRCCWPGPRWSADALA